MIWTLYNKDDKKLAVFDTEEDQLEKWGSIVDEVATKVAEVPGSYALPGRRGEAPPHPRKEVRKHGVPA